MNCQHATFVYPGDLDTRTGGYRYDKRMVEELVRGTGSTDKWNINLLQLHGDYPFPTPAQLADAATALDAIADHSLTIIDGLAFSVMPDVVASHANRLNMIALIHHPLALETGLTDTQSASLKALETRALQYAFRVITTSGLTASSLSQYEVPAHKVCAVLPGTDNALIAEGSTDSTVNLLCVATLTQRKGHRVLLDALATLDHAPWHLYCVGSTDRDIPNYQALLEQRKHLSLEDCVSFVGELDDRALDDYYRRADVFVLASFHEGYGMVLSEAIARGLPIICSDAGAMSQTVPAGCGILVPPGDPGKLADALDSFFSDEKLRTRLKQAAVAARTQLRSWPTAALEFSGQLIQAQHEYAKSRNA